MTFLVWDGSDLNGIQSPLEIRYMKYLKIMMIIIGAWPGKALGEKETHRSHLRLFNISISSFTMITGLIYIRKIFGKLTFFELGQTYITAMMNVVCLTRFISVYLSNKLDKTIVNFVRDVHLFNHRNDFKFAGKMNLNIHRLSFIYTLYTMVLVMFVPAFFNITPLINNISNGAFTGQLDANKSYEHAVYYELPFDYEHNYTGFMVIFIFNWYISFSCSCIFLNYDLIVAILVFHLWGHLKILTYNLEHIPLPGFVFVEELEDSNKPVTSNNMTYTDEELVEVNKRLKSILNHHSSILKNSDDISKAVGVNVALYYLFHQISGCLLLLECSQLDTKALIRFGPLTLCLIQLLATVSVIFELIKSMTDHVVRAAYNTPWEFMDVKNRRLVLMLLRQTQVPLGLKAAGVVEVGVETMVAILKTTLSYFMVLRTTEYN